MNTEMVKKKIKFSHKFNPQPLDEDHGGVVMLVLLKAEIGTQSYGGSIQCFSRIFCSDIAECSSLENQAKYAQSSPTNRLDTYLNLLQKSPLSLVT